MKKSLVVALSGIVTALSVVLMFLGAVVWVFNYVAPILSGLLLIIICGSVDKRNAWYVFAGSSVLSLILLPDKEGALLYAFFFGYYPIIRDSINSIASAVLRTLLKLVVFNAGVVLSQVICVYVFHIPFDNFMGRWSAIILLVLANVVLFLYDRMFAMALIVYDRKYKRIIEKLLR